eukprot:scaffold41684_cov160-Amphora_coffeaeformis.AAC.3
MDRSIGDEDQPTICEDTLAVPLVIALVKVTIIESRSIVDWAYETSWWGIGSCIGPTLDPPLAMPPIPSLYSWPPPSLRPQKQGQENPRERNNREEQQRKPSCYGGWIRSQGRGAPCWVEGKTMPRSEGFQIRRGPSPITDQVLLCFDLRGFGDHPFCIFPLCWNIVSLQGTSSPKRLTNKDTQSFEKQADTFQPVARTKQLRRRSS